MYILQKFGALVFCVMLLKTGAKGEEEGILNLKYRYLSQLNIQWNPPLNILSFKGFPSSNFQFQCPTPQSQSKLKFKISCFSIQIPLLQRNLDEEASLYIRSYLRRMSGRLLTFITQFWFYKRSGTSCRLHIFHRT
jgi:hypothetical protein